MLLKSHAQYLLQDIIQKARRKRLEEKQNKTKLGMMRHLYVILDMSEAMKAQDFKPTRLEILKIWQQIIIVALLLKNILTALPF